VIQEWEVKPTTLEADTAKVVLTISSTTYEANKKDEFFWADLIYIATAELQQPLANWWFPVHFKNASMQVPKIATTVKETETQITLKADKP
jgi:hypothetical protein